MVNLSGLPKGAIFDQDGLLFDTEVIFEQSWIKAGEELGLPVTLELTHKLSGRGKKELAAAAERRSLPPSLPRCFMKPIRKRWLNVRIILPPRRSWR